MVLPYNNVDDVITFCPNFFPNFLFASPSFGIRENVFLPKNQKRRTLSYIDCRVILIYIFPTLLDDGTEKQTGRQTGKCVFLDNKWTAPDKPVHISCNNPRDGQDRGIISNCLAKCTQKNHMSALSRNILLRIIVRNTRRYGTVH